MNSKFTPTKGNLLASKNYLVFAKTGFSLLDKKQNILIKELMALVSRADEIRKNIDKVYAEAYSGLQQANVSMKNCREISMSVPILDNLNLSFRSVMGVEIPIFNFVELKDNKPTFGLHDSNSYLDEAYLKFKKVLNLTVRYAEIENSIYRLARVIKKTKKRANALKNSIIPKFSHAVKFIGDALEEKEREEFSRLKVIKNFKRS
ncbi:MAG: V-type ATP synthase subunit D [Clostridia bacterium]|nr:V-type ATP synthase subunit D [Clostridia bacterium]